MLNGKMSISRPSGNGCDYIAITVNDSTSGVEFTEIHIKYADLAEALTGHGSVSCEFELNGVDKIGMRREHKTETVFIPKSVNYGDNEARRAEVAKHEVDGWIGYLPDASNHHRMTKTTSEGAYYLVNFTRFVK